MMGKLQQKKNEDGSLARGGTYLSMGLCWFIETKQIRGLVTDPDNVGTWGGDRHGILFLPTGRGCRLRTHVQQASAGGNVHKSSLIWG